MLALRRGRVPRLLAFHFQALEGATVRGDEYIAKILKDEGVSWLSCFPSNPMIEALAREGIRPIAFRHERGAVMAADGNARSRDLHTTTPRVQASGSRHPQARPVRPRGRLGQFHNVQEICMYSVCWNFFQVTRGKRN